MTAAAVPTFRRAFFGAAETFTRIGHGALGGKAAGLEMVRQRILGALEPAEFPGVQVVVPTLTVVTTSVFEAFMARNHLDEVALADLPDDRIAHACQRADFPAEHVGDLRALISQVHTPLAVRSSSRLEDALAHPFAGVYGTKMIPNNKLDVDQRFHGLAEAVKYVYASTFFGAARSYRRTVGRADTGEQMAVIIQEVVGLRRGDRYYPTVSGVARSYNYYPSGRARPEDGVVNLALGLGKQIVDGGVSWTYAPPYPKAPPPYNDMRDLLKNSQTRFWAVNMGRTPVPDPIRETEYLVQLSLSVAEADEALRFVASTYDAQSDRLRPGVAGRGPRVLDFAPLLGAAVVPLNDLVRRLLALSEEALGTAVEIEFALNLNPERAVPARFGFLQVRPMMVSTEEIEVGSEEMRRPGVLLASEQVLGNGVRRDIADVVYLRPQAFQARHTPQIAREIDRLNRALLDAGRPYLLIGFGRWGSSDPWLGVPVEWGHISGVGAIVEATRPDMNPELSQGSHFFHNLIGFRILYLSVAHEAPLVIDWPWLERQAVVAETEFVRHVRLDRPLEIRVDGRRGRGVVRHG